MQSHIDRHHTKNLCQDAVQTVPTRRFNAWAVPVVGVPMAKANQFQTQQQRRANQFARKSVKLIFDDHRHVVRVLVE